MYLRAYPRTRSDSLSERSYQGYGMRSKCSAINNGINGTFRLHCHSAKKQLGLAGKKVHNRYIRQQPDVAWKSRRRIDRHGRFRRAAIEAVMSLEAEEKRSRIPPGIIGQKNPSSQAIQCFERTFSLRAGHLAIGLIRGLAAADETSANLSCGEKAMHIYGPSQMHGPQSIASPARPPAGTAHDPARGRRRSPTKSTSPMPLGWWNRSSRCPRCARIASRRSASRSPRAPTRPATSSTPPSSDCWMRLVDYADETFPSLSCKSRATEVFVENGYDLHSPR